MNVERISTKLDEAVDGKRVLSFGYGMSSAWRIVKRNGYSITINKLRYGKQTNENMEALWSNELSSWVIRGTGRRLFNIPSTEHLRQYQNDPDRISKALQSRLKNIADRKKKDTVAVVIAKQSARVVREKEVIAKSDIRARIEKNCHEIEKLECENDVLKALIGVK